MKKISCCVLDLDGTLLNSKGEINEGDRQALIAMKEKGCHVVIATGRTELQIFEYIDALQINGPIIGCNGGLIKHTGTKEILHITYFDPAVVQEITDYCKREKLDYLLYNDDYVYHCPGSRRIEKFKTYNLTCKPEHRVPIRCVDELAPGEAYRNIIKILIIDKISRIPEVNALFNQDHSLTVVTSGENLIDIMPGHTTKGQGVELLAQKLGVPLAEVAVFGDSPNDETMFEVAGIAVAMGNADPHLKEIANYVTATNDEEGIRQALEHFAK